MRVGEVERDSYVYISVCITCMGMEAIDGIAAASCPEVFV